MKIAANIYKLVEWSEEDGTYLKVFQVDFLLTLA
jgi:hypothetical protein